MSIFFHPLSDVKTKVVGDKTKVWQFSVVLEEAELGKECNICSHCFIENEVLIGDRVTIKNGCKIYDGVVIENDVFIGPNVVFTNDIFPRSKKFLNSYPLTRVQEGASIGGGAVILPGVIIGKGAMVGAGSVVTKSIPENAIYAGNPARRIGSVFEKDNK